MVGTITIPGSAHDFSGDNDSDIVWHDSSGNVAIWLLNGSQVQQSGGLGVVPTNWSIVGQRDFNGDTNYDLLWHDATTETVAIWLMNGRKDKMYLRHTCLVRPKRRRVRRSSFRHHTSQRSAEAARAPA
jgi:hypothetical protein